MLVCYNESPFGFAAEFGDFDGNEHTPGFISEFRFVPESVQTETMELAILEAYPGCMYVYLYVQTHAQLHKQTCECTHKHTNTFVQTDMNAHKSTQTHMHKETCECTQKYTNTCANRHVSAHTNTFVQTDR